LPFALIPASGVLLVWAVHDQLRPVGIALDNPAQIITQPGQFEVNETRSDE
jgi:hypothetical protein